MSEPLYPVSLRLRDKPVLVVGGGPVAARKVRRLRDCGALVTLVSPTATREIEQAASQGAILWHRRSFTPSDVEGAMLVLSATGDEAVDASVAAAAQGRSLWVNVADSAVEGDVQLPALVRRGALTVTVSTAGAAPGFAARLVRELETQLGEVGPYVELLGELRQELRQRFPDAAQRQRAFGAALDCAEAREHAQQGRLAEARQALREAAGRSSGDEG